CQKAGIKNIGDIKIKLEALQDLRKESSFESITTIFKRATNIVNQARKQKLNIYDHIDVSLLKEDAEKNLYEKYSVIDGELITLIGNKKYYDAINKLNELKPFLDSFFENVMVMCEDEKLKLNRISLINFITDRFNSFIALSLLQ
ncbi:MAG: DALR anticodon-binding domain-containing protein, partial [Endomicrobiaceae bacterium]